MTLLNGYLEMGKKTGHQTTAHYLYPATNANYTPPRYMQEKRAKGQKTMAKRYLTKSGWMTTSDISKATGIKICKLYKLLKTKTADQIIEGKEDEKKIQIQKGTD